MTMVVVSAQGGVSAVTDHSDWPTQQACEQTKAMFASMPTTAEMGGVHLTIKSNAKCIPVDAPGGPPMGYNGGPQPGPVYRGPRYGGPSLTIPVPFPIPR